MSDVIESDELNSWLKKAPEWELEGSEIFRVVEFDEFMEGIEFINDVAEIAEDAGHHPDIDIRWTKITLRLTTHDEGGLTEDDFAVAQRIDNLID